MSEQPPKKDDPDDLADLLAALEEVTRKEKTGELARLNAEQAASEEATPDESKPDEESSEEAKSDEPPKQEPDIERAHVSFGVREQPATPSEPDRPASPDAEKPAPSGGIGQWKPTRPTDASATATPSVDAPAEEKPATPKGLFTGDRPAAPSPTGGLDRPRQTGPAIRPTPPLPPRSTTTTEPVEVKYRYRIALVLSPELELQLNAARQSVSIPVARPGIFALQEDFESSDIDAVQVAIKSWAANHLPIDTEVERVVAEVVGEQRYIAGFALEPAQKINAAQQALASALASNIRPAAQDALPFTPRLPVSDHTSAADFPRLIHELQKRFEPSEWKIESVELLRVPEDDERWEVVQKF